ncbi:hypothetical protein SERLADRAFT_352554 [Serpula lacrymans var. lacrymans S7.9]|uniref:Proline dehydrogenase n=1 Tax=Serpula lacrymans var. lacrymans (strain S7.9) TaxID=578457 RepID=F8PAZ0_SERL9|nr:uncharacterized protein SERLADRAFT_352554 [Serpula lacrymans var. lacrymans S7.9]EGO19430.1 hypothetical protein SERLADRAFT_352554 [Serpula lacrymans var. lacrymans S7.9]
MSRSLSRLSSLSRIQTPVSVRAFRTHATPRYVLSRRVTRLGLASGAVLGASLLLGGQVYAEAPPSDPDSDAQRQPTPLTSLLRSYAVYSMCSIPMLVDWSPTILSTLMSIPGINLITEAIVRATFFSQFVGGDTAHQAVPLVEQLRAENKGTLFAYSVEVDEKEAAGKSQHRSKNHQPVHKRIVQEMIRSIEVAAEFEDKFTQGSGADRRTWVAVKLTALLPDAQALINMSSHIVNMRPATSPPVAFPGTTLSSDMDILRQSSIPAGSPVTQENVIELRDLHSDLVKICTRAQERGVKIIIDAEHRYVLPAIDAITQALMEQFNKLAQDSSKSDSIQPLIYNTYQAYLRRTPEHLKESLRRAKAGNYSLGVKLVRGAYHPHETHAHASKAASAKSLSISPDPHPPVWSTKAETDNCYNSCAELLIDRIKDDMTSQSRGKTPSSPALGVLFGTHNWDSCNRILEALVSRGLAEKEKRNGESDEIVRIGTNVTERVTLGQLYGMSDALTNYLVDKTRSSAPFVIKYVPYGALVEVMPYLSRRAIENKSVLGDGGAADERRRAGAEIRKRLFG